MAQHVSDLLGHRRCHLFRGTQSGKAEFTSFRGRSSVIEVKWLLHRQLEVLGYGQRQASGEPSWNCHISTETLHSLPFLILKGLNVDHPILSPLLPGPASPVFLPGPFICLLIPRALGLRLCECGPPTFMDPIGPPCFLKGFHLHLQDRADSLCIPLITFPSYSLSLAFLSTVFYFLRSKALKNILLITIFKNN